MSSQVQRHDVFGDLSHVDAAQARQCARVLIRRPLVRPDGPDGQLLPLMYRHRHELQSLFSGYLGYSLLVERRFARLYKRLDSHSGRGMSGFTPRAQGIRKVGRVTCSAQGIFVVENSEAFERVCLLDDITERWLCVWNQGTRARGSCDSLQI